MLVFQVKYKAGNKNRKMEVQVPASWQDITLGQFLSYREQFAEVDEDALPETYNLKVFCHFSGTNEEAIKQLPTEAVEELLSYMGFMVQEPECKGISSFKLNGVEYHFPEKDLEPTTFGEYVDAKTVQKKQEEDSISALADVMAIYCRPKGEAYNSKQFAERREAFLQLDMQTVFEFGFFLSGQSEQLTNALVATYTAAPEVPKETLNALSDMVGTAAWYA